MPAQSFPEDLNFTVPVGREEGNRAFFGRDVLKGLVDGIDDYAHQRQPRWRHRTHRVGAPVLLGCSPWVNDRALLAVIETLPSACVVISKEPRTAADVATFDRLRQLNERTNGVELRALSELGDVAPKVGGKPKVIGPYDSMDSGFSLSTFRTIGHRKTGNRMPPIAHAKLALLGNLCWTDEHPSGHVDDYVWLSPRRLWVSSANFTYGSRRSAEFGYWTEDEDLVSSVALFLARLIGASEDLDSAADTPDPELARVEFDDVAMAQAWRELEEARAELEDEELNEDEW